jgi:ADP-dependent NAD(P)H-hydrate dehydratase
MSSPPRPEAARDGPAHIGADLLRDWPLPALNAGGDKAARGWVMCVGGSPELPGAIILASTAALRAGAGILCIGVPRSISLAVGVAVPEALAYGVRGTPGGGIDPREAAEIARRASGVHAVLIGPGMADGKSTARLLESLLPRLTETTEWSCSTRWRWTRRRTWSRQFATVPRGWS